jgi:uncharacterized repeat protein (TIGR01451 family)
MPSPVVLDIKLEVVSGGQPKVGAKISYKITITNNGYAPVDHITIWDSLPVEVKFSGSSFTGAPAVQNGNIVSWDITNKEISPGVFVPFSLAPGDTESIWFDSELLNAAPDKLPLMDFAATDYNDPYYYTGGPFGKHPPVISQAAFYPQDKIWVFPNPFNPDKDGTVKFDNVVPGSVIQIYTISGEMVRAIPDSLVRAEWDGKNRYGRAVSSGIYFFVIKNQDRALKGKIFVIK